MCTANRCERIRCYKNDLNIVESAVISISVFLAYTPEFIATRKLQPRFPTRIRVRSKGLDRNEWIIRDGFAVTSVVRTTQDLAGEAIDSGHLGQFVSDAIRTRAASKQELQEIVGPNLRVDALLAMAEK